MEKRVYRIKPYCKLKSRHISGSFATRTAKCAQVALLHSLILTAVVEVLPPRDVFIQVLCQDKEALWLKGFEKERAGLVKRRQQTLDCF